MATSKRKRWLEVISRSGRKFKVDIFDTACVRFGFKHGDKIISPSPNGAAGTIMGVALESSPPRDADYKRRYVLWYALDHDKGQACFHFYHGLGGQSHNLYNLGFRLRSKSA